MENNFFRVCRPCVFSGDCCVCVTCMTLTKKDFLKAIEKISSDFTDLKKASLEILIEQGGKDNHDEVLRIIKNDQSDKAVELLTEVASIMSDFLKTAGGKLAGEEMEKAKKLIAKVNQFLDNSLESCNKAFGDFHEPKILNDLKTELLSWALLNRKAG